MGAGTREGAAGGGGKRPKLAANDMQCTCKGQLLLLPHAPISPIPAMELLAEAASSSDIARATGRRDQRDRSGRTQDRSGRKQDRSGRKQDRRGRKQVRVQQSGHANRAAKRQKAEAAPAEHQSAADSTAAESTAASSAAGIPNLDLVNASSTAISTAVSTAVSSSSAVSSSAVSSTVGSSAVGSCAVSSTISFSAVSYSAVSSSTVVSSAVVSSAICSDPADPVHDADDPYAGFGSDSGSWSGLDSPTRAPYFPEGSEEAEIREAEMRAACDAADRQRRARAEISAADATACAACAGHMAGWQPSDDEPMVTMISDYEIERLQNVVANEQGLLDLNLISSSQLSLSTHTLERNLDLQCMQLSRVVATTAIAQAIRNYYVEQYPALAGDF